MDAASVSSPADVIRARATSANDVYATSGPYRASAAAMQLTTVANRRRPAGVPTARRHAIALRATNAVIAGKEYRPCVPPTKVVAR